MMAMCHYLWDFAQHTVTKISSFFRRRPRANPADAAARRACMRSQSLGHEYRRGQKHGKQGAPVRR